MFCGMVQNKPLDLVYSIVQGAVVAKGSLRQWVSRCRFLSEGEAAPTVVLGAGPLCEDSASRRTLPRCSTSLWRAPPCRTPLRRLPPCSPSLRLAPLCSLPLRRLPREISTGSLAGTRTFLFRGLEGRLWTCSF